MAGYPDVRQPRLVAMFEGEIADRTRSLEDGILALPGLPRGERAARLGALARDAHTLKGSAAMMEAGTIVRLCHGLEDELDELRGADAIDADVVTRLLHEVDRIRAAGAEVTGTAVQPPAGPSTPIADPVVERTSGPPAGGTIRLPTQKLDRLLTGVADLRAATSSLLALAGGDRRLRPALRGIDRAVGGIDRAVRDTVTVPVSEACEGLPRAVRDIGEAEGKQVRIRFEVGDAEIDRRAIGVVRDALLHLVRNAADHGIEPPAARRHAGKTPTGTVVVAAEVQGDRVAVTVRDDGRGIHTDAVRAAAARAGLADGTDANELVFAAGLSTAEVASDISGRGVGLDAVRDRVESLGGAITLRSEPGRGTEVTLIVPASLATARVLLVEAAGAQVALLTASVQRLVRVTTDDVVTSEGRTLLRHADDLVPLIDLAEAAGLPGPGRSSAAVRAWPAVIVATGADAVTALLVDGVVGEQELLIQPVGPMLAGLPALVGAGVLSSGDVVLLLHPAALVRSAQRRPAVSPAAVDVAAARDGRGRVLLVEDAPTTRALEQGLLEAAGYEVVAAEDGQQAWELLDREEVDVVVSDVEMPRLDGIELCRRIRASSTLEELPVILVTSRGSEDDRRRGAGAGADAYLVKSAFAQGELIAAIERSLR